MKLKLNVFILMFITNLNCYLHHVNISGDMYGAKEINPFSNSINVKNLPVRIDFDSKEKE